MVLSYQEKTDKEDGFFLDKDQICFQNRESVLKRDLLKDDRDLSLDYLLRSFKALDYFSDSDFAIGTPVTIKASISVDYAFDSTASGIFTIDSPSQMISSSTWDADWETSSLFSWADQVPLEKRPYLPEGIDCTEQGWVFSAPFLYSGVFVKDTVLRKRVLLAIESVLYRIENKTVANNPHLTEIDNIFSAKDSPWSFNIPVLGA